MFLSAINNGALFCNNPFFFVSLQSGTLYCVFYGMMQINGKVKPQNLIWGEVKEEVKLTTFVF